MSLDILIDIALHLMEVDFREYGIHLFDMRKWLFERCGGATFNESASLRFGRNLK